MYVFGFRVIVCEARCSSIGLKSSTLFLSLKIKILDTAAPTVIGMNYMPPQGTFTKLLQNDPLTLDSIRVSRCDGWQPFREVKLTIQVWFFSK